MPENHYLVPQQEQGSEKDLEYNIAARTVADAEFWFIDAKDRMLDVNSWSKYCSEVNVAFRLTDHHGLGVGRHARKADMVRIDMPGPDGARLGGFEWVSVEAIEYDDYPDTDMETFAMRLRAAESPLNHKDANEGHVTGNATSTFVIERHGAKLSASYHGRNEQGNVTNEWLGMPDTELVCLIKAFIGISS